MSDDQMKKYIKQAITELDKAHEKRSKEKDQKADQRIIKHLEGIEERADRRIEATLKRHIGALTEDFQDKLSGLAEMVGGLMVKATETKDTLDIVQSDVEIIKNDLKQKVDRSEFEALVKRVSFVEKKISTR
ncbi:MAG: hypothetical protein NTV02_01880 [Candidatus Zambryskibacteria bacterium]|nr:hypothetical protein [Candidatus Zambryskibacteria bacterium]